MEHLELRTGEELVKSLDKWKKSGRSVKVRHVSLDAYPYKLIVYGDTPTVPSKKFSIKRK